MGPAKGATVYIKANGDLLEDLTGLSGGRPVVAFTPWMACTDVGRRARQLDPTDPYAGGGALLPLPSGDGRDWP